MVSPPEAEATQNNLTLGQIKTDQKSNEITAIPSASGGLEMLELHGCIVTVRSLTSRTMGCQREIAQQITDGGANYVLAVKENQGQLYAGIRDLFEGAEALSFDGCPTTTLRVRTRDTDGWNGGNAGPSRRQTA